jgi:hypothetical protein
VQRWNRIGAEPEKLLAAIRAYLASPEAKKTTPDGVAGGFVNAFEVWLNKYAEFWLERTASIVPAHSDADLRAARIAWAKAKHDWRAEWGSPDPEVLPFLKAQGAAP